jgi:hypothetical protein
MIVARQFRNCLKVRDGSQGAARIRSLSLRERVGVRARKRISASIGPRSRPFQEF